MTLNTKCMVVYFAFSIGQIVMIIVHNQQITNLGMTMEWGKVKSRCLAPTYVTLWSRENPYRVVVEQFMFGAGWSRFA